ncbi:hypothetical protein WHR41_05147 [Cladosporium halotolerans]|uniref:Uncharacterized protein n=1 Tax=Cladosporium halotolerans TaxID=1052096 RepID=A0AB34KQ20_9PEZI
MAESPSTPARPSPMGGSDSDAPGLLSTVKNSSASMEKTTNDEQRNHDITVEMPDTHQDHDDKGTSNVPSRASLVPRAQSATATPSTVKADRVITDPAMPPPSRPNFKATATYAQPPQTTDNDVDEEAPSESTCAEQDHDDPHAPSSEMATQKTPHAPSRKRSHEKSGRQQDLGEGQNPEPTDIFYEPANAIEAFDWEDLESRYHHHMQDFAAQEQDIYTSFNELCGYFSVWAETGHTREVDRSFKRLKTQSTLVRHHEEELESKRHHYVKVVDAFKSALQLLGTGS